MHAAFERVKFRSRTLSLAKLGLFLFTFGCATTTPSKPQETTAQQRSAPAPTEQSNSAAIPQASVSSLDALQRGELPVTPDSSPLKEIYFDFDRSDLSADARETLQTNAEWLKSKPSDRMEIEGHCDERGTTEYNLALGAKRAQAALDYLVTLGIAPARLSTISYGNELPVCREHAENCWQKNRRDRFVMKTSQTN